MKRFITYTVFLLLPVFAFAQPASSIDFGAGVGVSSYYGDINQEKALYNAHLSMQGFFRYNLNNRYALRVNLMSTTLKASDSDFKNPYQQRRNKAFERSILELGLMGEINFFPYQNPPEWGVSNGTIYAVLGVGYAVAYAKRAENENFPNFTFGVGYKRAFYGRWAVEFEWVFRKLLYDRLDGISDPMKSGQKSSLFNNDFYNVVGVSLSYNLWQESGKCRTFDRDTDL